MSKKLEAQIQLKNQELAALLKEKQKKKEEEAKIEEKKHMDKMRKKFAKLRPDKKLKILETVVSRCSYESLSDDEYFDGYKEIAVLFVQELKSKKTKKTK